MCLEDKLPLCLGLSTFNEKRPENGSTLYSVHVYNHYNEYKVHVCTYICIHVNQVLYNNINHFVYPMNTCHKRVPTTAADKRGYNWAELVWCCGVSLLLWSSLSLLLSLSLSLSPSPLLPYKDGTIISTKIPLYQFVSQLQFSWKKTHTHSHIHWFSQN